MDWFAVEMGGWWTGIASVADGQVRLAGVETLDQSVVVDLRGQAPTVESIEAALKRERKSDDVFVSRRSIPPGRFHPRVWRKEHQLEMAHGRTLTIERQGLRAALISTAVPARALLERMRRVFEVIEPSRQQLGAYGHELRQLLILACTEVESAWKGVLRANMQSPPSDPRWTTKDYVKLLEPMRLRLWSVRLALSAEGLSFAPFAEWDEKTPTESLPWYAAYHRVKHDREQGLCDANVGAMLEAMAAMYIMAVAQFGETEFDRFQSGEFIVTQRPRWKPADAYLARQDAAKKPLWEEQKLF